MTTTSATGGIDRVPRAGFTLIEVVIVLVIISLVLGLIVPSVSDLLKYEELRGVAAETCALVKMARREAVVQRRDLWIEFDGIDIRVVPAEAPDTVVHEIQSSAALRSLMKIWPEPEWQKFKGQRVRVTEEGIVAPFEVLYRHGEAWISYRYDPLTGGVAEEQNYFP